MFWHNGELQTLAAVPGDFSYPNLRLYNIIRINFSRGFLKKMQPRELALKDYCVVRCGVIETARRATLERDSLDLIQIMSRHTAPSIQGFGMAQRKEDPTPPPPEPPPQGPAGH